MLSNILKEQISEGKLDEIILKLYVDESLLSYQKERYINAISGFEKLYGEADVTIFSAPGRTEIGGNHTDHQHGQVLAGAINRDAIAVVTPSDSVKLFSEGYSTIEFDITDTDPVASEAGTTKALIRGVLDGMKKNGHATGGFKAYVTSDVLSGSGLSSSAAFESLIGVIISGLYNDSSIDPVEIAKIGQYSENVFLGKPCGLMDQMASSVGSLCYIDFKDTKNPVIEKIEFDMESVGYCLCITDTKGSHSDLTPDYAAIPAEMKAAAAVFGKEYLREVSKEDILNNLDKIRKTAGDRAALRAIHFAGETERAELEAKALKTGSFDDFLRYFKESGDSSFKYLQNIYSNSKTDEQSVSLGLALSDMVLAGGKGIARVHGGGFAGTIQAFVRLEAADAYISAMDGLFGDGSCQRFSIRKQGCIKVIG